MLRHVWGRAGEAEQQASRGVHVRQLRRKLEPDPDRPRYLVTKPRVGYRLLADE